MFKAAYFDLDGTLVDVPLDYIERLLKKAMKRKSVDPDKTARFWYGFNMDETPMSRDAILIRELGLGPKSLAQFWKSFNENDTRRGKISSAYPDAIETVTKLHTNGFNVSVVTGSLRANAEYSLAKIGRSYFDQLVSTHDEGIFHKPHPSGIEHCMNISGHSKRDVIYVGNSGEDYHMATAAGVDVRLIYRPHQLQRINPAVRLESLTEVFSLFGIR